ncbi:MAG TPA: RNA ligase family protein [Isosphaeraceae bacterium]|nr:RNA ligase family protein [Isosphaeraceae bacterium]
MMDFQSFQDIEAYESLVTISEKIDGTNAQIAIGDLCDTFQVGSRTRWITPEDDNFGFARWAYDRKDALIQLLGPGRHFGEWYGSGIGRTYGLKEKRLALFNTHRWAGKITPGWEAEGLRVVPVLYQGAYSPTIVAETMAKLKETGSVAVPGFKNPEGVVIFFSRSQMLLKKVFEKETTPRVKEPKAEVPVDPEFEAAVERLLQPIRLEKLLTRDEKYIREYPKSLPKIVGDYMADLLKEGQLPQSAPVVQEARKRAFAWVRSKVGK